MPLMYSQRLQKGSPLMFGAIVAALLANAAQAQSGSDTDAGSGADSGIQTSVFGHLPDGRQVDVYQFTNANGIELRVTNYGGIILSLKTPNVMANLTISRWVSTLWKRISLMSIARQIPTSAPSLGVTAIVLRMASSPLMAKAIHWPPMMAAIIFTAAIKGSIKCCGKPNPL